MIFVPSNVLGWRPIAEAWVKKDDFVPLKSNFPLLVYSLENVFYFVKKSFKLVMQTGQVHIVTSLLNIFESLVSTRDEDGYIKLNIVEITMLQKLFLFATMWAIGGLLDEEGRTKFSEFLFKEFKPNLSEDIELSKLFDYVCDVESGGRWVHWNTRLQPYIYLKEETPEFSTILIPTVDNLRIEYLMNLLSRGGISCLLIGDSGTAKTATINTFLSKFEKDKWVTKIFGFSSATTPYLFQTSIESVIEKTIGTTFGPVGGKRMQVFIDDISMPLINEWGDQVTNEIVRQLMEFNRIEVPSGIAQQV
jgi:dynein heavy chain